MVEMIEVIFLLKNSALIRFSIYNRRNKEMNFRRINQGGRTKRENAQARRDVATGVAKELLGVLAYGAHELTGMPQPSTRCADVRRTRSGGGRRCPNCGR